MMVENKDSCAIMLLVALAGCSAETIAAQKARLAEREQQQVYDRTYDSCLYRVTGPFAGASFDVMQECERQARAASGIEARQGGDGEAGSVHESAVAKPDAQSQSQSGDTP